MWNIQTPIVALHSSASSRSQWNLLSDSFKENIEVIAPNLPGYGKQSLTSDSSQSGMGTLALPVIRQILENNRQVHLVGHSHGAAVAIKIALMRPDLVKSLTLYEPAAFHILNQANRDDKKLYNEIKLVSALLTTAAATARPDLGMKQFIDFWNGEGAWDNSSIRHQELFTNQATSIMSDFARGFSETWTLNDLRNLNIPTLMMIGMKSPTVAKRAASLIGNALPKARVKFLENSSHMAPVQTPELVNTLICDHIFEEEKKSFFSYEEMLSAA